MRDIQGEGKRLYEKLKEIYLQIVEDIEMLSDPNISQADRIKGFTRMTKDMVVLAYTATSIFNVNAHPNIIDFIGAKLTTAFMEIDEMDTTGKFDMEKARLAVFYFTFIAYAFVFIFIAYIATENWYYFLFYKFSHDITISMPADKEGNVKDVPFSLNVMWEYFQVRQPNIFGVFHALFFVVTALDTLLRKIRSWARGYFDMATPFIRIALFLFIYYLFHYWTTVTNSAAFEWIFWVVIMVSVALICITTFGSFGFTPPSPYFAPGYMHLAITLIKFFVVSTIDTALMTFGKTALYIYIIVMSFAIIIITEKRNTPGKTSRFFAFDTIHQMAKFDLLKLKGIAKQKGAGFLDKMPFWVEANWLSISVFLIFLFLFVSLYNNTKDIQAFAPVFYFICFFWIASFFKGILNYITKIHTDAEPVPDLGQQVLATPPLFVDTTGVMKMPEKIQGDLNTLNGKLANVSSVINKTVLGIDTSSTKPLVS